MNAFEFVDNASASINSMMKQGLFSTGTKAVSYTHLMCIRDSSETLKVADFIINSESGMAYGSINEEGKRCV